MEILLDGGFAMKCWHPSEPAESGSGDLAGSLLAEKPTVTVF